MNKKTLSFIIICIGVFLALSFLFFTILLSILSESRQKQADELIDKLGLLKENYIQLEKHLIYLNETCGFEIEVEKTQMECDLECLSDYEPIEGPFTLIPVGGFMWGY